MCFSATASFAGAAVITTAGVVALTLVEDKRQIPYAALPLGFGIHQFLEGLTWVQLEGTTGTTLTGWAVHLWVFFAWAFLPFYVPFAVWLMEPDPRRRRWLLAPLTIGSLLALYMTYHAIQPEIDVLVIDGNLDYHLAVPFLAVFVAAPYVFATCIGPMLSSYRWVAAFGVANLVAMSVATYIEARDYSSIWCTFAAFLSLMIVGHFVIERRRRLAGLEHQPRIAPA
jgi:hypothetical protein